MIEVTNQAQKDSPKITSSNLKGHVQRLIHVIGSNPFQKPPPCEKLMGDLAGAYSRRINIQHLLSFQV